MKPRRTKFSQHFLNSSKIAERIVDSADIKGRTVIEIGPGKGILTRSLADKAAQVIAIELDPCMIDNLRALSRPNVQVIRDDFLRHDIRQYGRVAVVGNIPYAISSPLVEKLVRDHGVVTHATLTVQQEFARRLIAHCGARSYGFISLYVNFYFSAARIFTIAPRFFTPVPAVGSAVVRLDRQGVSCALNNEPEFFEFVRSIFRYPRKSVRNAVAQATGIILKSTMDSRLRQRPADLSIQDYCHLYSLLQDTRC